LFGLAGNITTMRKASVGGRRDHRKLVLEINQVTGGAQCAQVRLEDAEVAARHRVVEPLGHGPHDLQLHVASARRFFRPRFEELACHRLPALSEVTSDIADRRPAQPCRDVVPAHPSTRRMLRCVVAIATEVRQVDAADEGDLVVDHDELLVVTVQRTLVRVQRDLDARAAHQLVAPRAHAAATRREHGHRSPRPQQHAHVDRCRRLGEQLAQQHRRLIAHEREPRRDAPARDQHAATRSPNRLLERREVRRALDQHVERIARTRRRISRRPQASVIRRRALRGAPEPTQPAGVVRLRRSLDRIPSYPVGGSQRVHGTT
jgi:hypothetical protein